MSAQPEHISPVRVAILGGSGYTGGELARLLLQHPYVQVSQIASAHHAGSYLHALHPNLRPAGGRPPIRLVAPDALEPCDVLFVAQPHGVSMGQIERYIALAPRVIDLSADFRLRRYDAYTRWYGHAHPRPDLLARAVYGIPELHRAELPEARLISGAGCLATAAILALAPLARAGVLDREAPLVIEAKVGSSAAGTEPGAGSHHPDRSHAVRSFAPTGHRHTAEIMQELDWPEASNAPGTSSGVYFSATAVELVRGALVTAQAFLRECLSDGDLWRLYRAAYGSEPFMRIVKERSGIYRYPEPKLLIGSNYCDIGFEVEPGTRRVVVLAALDNLMKGAAGNAVQALDAAMGWDETTGLTFTGLHPI
ncbi:MAG TPA: N-acetyl-gamma-glutamyl-phosphate reductase [Ktedonobacterales bacterium]|nr:N-acetyl-gamma-glutamyl-phosphate reductase [Ktedonobacterales bacterium]